MNSRNKASSVPITEETIFIHKGHLGRIAELSTLALEEIGQLIYVELVERSRDYQGYLEELSLKGQTPESKL